VGGEVELPITTTATTPATVTTTSRQVPGVLALQGGFGAHLRSLGPGAIDVRSAAELERCDSLVLPGGESTTQAKLIELGGLKPALDAFVASGRPVFATCAGLILCARFGWLDVSVTRNAYGRQADSFEAMDDSGTRRLIFIRAPRIDRVGAGVEVLATWRGSPVLVRQRNVTGACYHPELSPFSDAAAHSSAPDYSTRSEALACASRSSVSCRGYRG
jgi:5'-phosphate synthase pdxT subunit